MSFNPIPKNKILLKNSEFTVCHAGMGLEPFCEKAKMHFIFGWAPYAIQLYHKFYSEVQIKDYLTHH